MNLKNKNRIFLVTGCGKGIGRAIALEIARSADLLEASVGKKISLCGISRTKADLDSLGNEISKLNKPVEFVSFVADLSKTQDIDRVFDEVKNKVGPVTDFVFNAGNGVFKSPGDFTEADYNQVFDLNVRGTFWFAQKAFSEFKKAGAQALGNSLSFVTSTAAEKVYDQSLLYCASKFAQKGLLEVLRVHCRPLGVRVINVLPGPVFTPMWGTQLPNTTAKMLQGSDVAQALVSALLQHPRVVVEEIQLRPVWGDIQSP